ncbi:hypothetical protein L7F22_027565 [Adiantum nelumboides]|nr:hypothetical protein [Adiantum nelumboides]
MALCMAERRQVRCDYTKFILESLIEANLKNSAKNKLYMNAGPMLTRVAYQALVMIKDLPVASSQASLIQQAKYVSKAVRTTSSAASSRSTRLKKSSSEEERTDTDKEQDSQEFAQEDVRKEVDAVGPSEYERSDEEDTSTPLEKRSQKPRSREQVLMDEAMARVEARRKELADARAAKTAKSARPMTMEEARKIRIEKAKAIQKKRRRIEEVKKAQEEAEAAQAARTQEKELAREKIKEALSRKAKEPVLEPTQGSPKRPRQEEEEELEHIQADPIPPSPISIPPAPPSSPIIPFSLASTPQTPPSPSPLDIPKSPPAPTSPQQQPFFAEPFETPTSLPEETAQPMDKIEEEKQTDGEQHQPTDVDVPILIIQEDEPTNEEAIQEVKSFFLKIQAEECFEFVKLQFRFLVMLCTLRLETEITGSRSVTGLDSGSGFLFCICCDWLVSGYWLFSGFLDCYWLVSGFLDCDWTGYWLVGLVTGSGSGPRLVSPITGMVSSSGSGPALAYGLEGQRDLSRVGDNEAAKPNKEDGYESRSGSDNLEGASGDEQDPEHARPNKKRYHRHAPAVIQELEAFFKECPHPDEKQRQDLSRRLNLHTRQVKFWFQNRRTQMKAQQERHENNILRQENERLRAENFTIREAMRNASCPTCGGPTAIEMSLEEQQIRFENARMREELERLYSMNGRLYGPRLLTGASPTATVPYATPPTHEATLGMFQSRELQLSAMSGFAENRERARPLTSLEKNMITELAVVAMEEFMKMVHASQPLWVPAPELGCETRETLDFSEYLNQFPRGIGPKPEGYRSEATREMGVVVADAHSIVESFLDVTRWIEFFPCIVSRAEVGAVISAGTPVSRNGALQLMFAELQVPSPLVPTRQLYFLRYCKMFTEGMWAVVDVSVDNLRGDSPSITNKYRRRPSGCLIQQLPSGFSKVSWVEHSEFDDSTIHQLYRPLVVTGMAFGAHRWVSTLRRQCERRTMMMPNLLTARGLSPEDVRNLGLFKLAQRMTTQLCSNVSSSSTWTTLSGNNGEEEVRVLTRESSSENPYEPSGMVLSAATSIWLPVSPQQVFDFLISPTARSKWDVLSLNGCMEELVSVSKGSDPGNYVSLLQQPGKGSAGNMLIFQECCSDASGSSFVYAPVDATHMETVMTSPADASIASVPILPSGFVILPDGRGSSGLHGGSSGLHGAGATEDRFSGGSYAGGSLVTIAFQILVNSMPKSKLTLESINTVNTLICNTIRNIKAALLGDDISTTLDIKP